jgi:beta-1,4-mannosyl-glycoprotein beta-1,4-N-acetylglucosaminyltransferase
MKLIDCFMYFDEELILDIRLNTLNKFVDYFVITEATFDHAGNSKKINFDIKNFSKFKDKIKHIIVDDLPQKVTSTKKNWHSAHVRDQFQRNALERGYKEFDNEDLIMISDIDEIPNPDKIFNFNTNNKYACFLQKNFQAKINRLNMTETYWPGTKICKKKNLKSPQWLRNIKVKEVPFWKFFKDRQPQIILDGGWHFSFLKSPELIQKKIKSFAHQEFNREDLVDINKIKNRIKLGTDIFDRNYKYQKINLNNDFPNYILENKIKFKDWII